MAAGARVVATVIHCYCEELGRWTGEVWTRYLYTWGGLWAVHPVGFGIIMKPGGEHSETLVLGEWLSRFSLSWLRHPA